MTESSPPRAVGPHQTIHARRAIAIALGTAVLGAGAFALYGPARSSPSERKPVAAQAGITVDVVAPMRTTFARSIAATGTVRARDELVIGSDAAGVRLLDVLVDVGATVRRGQLLARGDDAQLQAQLAQQDAQIRNAVAELAQARANVERSERIRESGVYSLEMLQTRQTAAEAASAKLELARAQRRELEVRIAQTRVLAPADGVITRKTATVGAVVQPGAELFRLIRDGQVEWLAELPGHAIAHVRPGARARVLLEGGEAIEATVRLIAPTIDAATRNGLVHVTLPQGVRLKAGALAKGEILLADTQALALPETSVLTHDGYPFVFVVGRDQVARRVRVETGVRQNGLVELSGGVTADVLVVSTGAGFVKDGDPVRVATKPAGEPRRAQSGLPAGGQS